MRLRVATWNIKHGHPRPARLARALRALADVDVLALQEVDVGQRRSGRVDQVAVASDALGMAGVFGKTLDRGGGEYGNALLVRGDLVVDQLLLPSGKEQRGALLARVDVRGAALSVVATHLSTNRRQSAEQLDVVLAALREMPPPRALLGDLNRFPAELPSPDGFVFAVGPKTFPRWWPKAQIDFVATSAGLSVRDLHARRLGLSDHRALVADVNWQPPAEDPRTSAAS